MKNKWGFLRVLADRAIPYVNELFNTYSTVQQCAGRCIVTKNLKDIDVLIIRSVTKIDSKLLSDGSVKFVGTTTSGIDHIDYNFLKKNNIKFVFAPGSNAVAVVEYVLSALFWLAKRDRFFLRDKIVGIVGVGHIGYLLYQRLHNFGVHTLLCDPYVELKNKFNGNWKSFDALISESNILTFHIPLTDEGKHSTWHMVNFDVLDTLPDNSILINTARGSVVDNHALLKILKLGKKISVVLDVWESEPNILIPLLDYIDIGTPHIAGYTAESKIRSIVKIYNEYCKYFGIVNDIKFPTLPSNYGYGFLVKKCDEGLINQLLQLIYDINLDHLVFRRYAIQLGGFELLRNRRDFRREWGSYYVKTGRDDIDNILMNLGFSIL